jgi:hypothetical protein
MGLLLGTYNKINYPFGMELETVELLNQNREL